MESGKVIAEGHVQLPAITPGETGKARFTLPASFREGDVLELGTNLDTVDHIELDVVVSNEALNLSRQMLLDAFHIPRAVQQEGTAVYPVSYTHLSSHTAISSARSSSFP